MITRHLACGLASASLAIAIVTSARADEPENNLPPTPPVVAEPESTPAVTEPAATPEPTVSPETLTSRVDRRVSMWRLEIGYRGSYVPSAGFDPFSSNDFLPQVSLAASRTLFASGRFSFAPGLAWDHGGSSANARGDTASLSLNRFTIPLEGRMHLGALGYVFVRGAPGVVLAGAEIDDESAPSALSKHRWLFATDVSGGYAWLVPTSRAPASKRIARLWIQADGGYGWVMRERMNLAPHVTSGETQLANGVDLGSLSMNGAFFRVGAAVSF